MKPWQVNLIAFAITIVALGALAWIIFLLIVYIDPIITGIGVVAPYIAVAVVVFFVFLFVRNQLLNSRWFRR